MLASRLGIVASVLSFVASLIEASIDHESVLDQSAGNCSSETVVDPIVEGVGSIKSSAKGKVLGSPLADVQGSSEGRTFTSNSSFTTDRADTVLADTVLLRKTASIDSRVGILKIRDASQSPEISPMSEKKLNRRTISLNGPTIIHPSEYGPFVIKSLSSERIALTI